MSSFSFFISQLFHFQKLSEDTIVAELENLNIDVADMLGTRLLRWTTVNNRLLILLIYLGKVSYELENKSFSPTMVHYVAMKGKSSVLKWIIKRMKEVNPDEYIEKLEETCSFGKQIGLVKVTPLVCAITCESIDTVRYFINFSNIKLQTQ